LERHLKRPRRVFVSWTPDLTGRRQFVLAFTSDLRRINRACEASRAEFRGHHFGFTLCDRLCV